MSAPRNPYRSEFARRHFEAGRAEGKAHGWADSVLKVLKYRGVTVSDGHRAIITRCTDPAQLETWLVSASTASGIQDLGGGFTGGQVRLTQAEADGH